MSALAIVPGIPETISGLSRRLAELLEQSESEGVQSQLPGCDTRTGHWFGGGVAPSHRP